jgi:hypothetical protein
MRSASIGLACLSFAAALAHGGWACAQEGKAAAPPTAEDVPWEVRVAYRAAWVESPGYAAFASNDSFSQVTVGASRLVASRGAFWLSVGADWDYGATGATARAQPSSLQVHRFTAPLTLHYTLATWLDAIATFAPGAAYQVATLQEASSPAQLVGKAWVPCADASAGLSWSFADTSVAGFPLVFRVIAEGGYAWSGRMDLSLTPELPGGSPQQVGSTDLGALAMTGGFGRVGVAVAF